MPEVPPVGGIGSPRVQAALQDYLTFSYMHPANVDMLQRLGELGDALLNIRQALNALNRLNNVVSLPIDKDNLDYVANIQNGTVLWNARSELVKGFDVLQAMFNNNQLQGNEDIVQDVLNQPIAYAGGSTTFADLVAAIKTTTLNQVQDAGITTQLMAWFDGGTSVMSNKVWDTQTNLSNAILQFSFLNDASRDRLQEAMLIYQEFANSASMALGKINRVFRDIANQIG